MNKHRILKSNSPSGGVRRGDVFEYLQRVAGFLQSGSDTGLALDQCDEVFDFLSVQVDGLKYASDRLSRRDDFHSGERLFA